MNTVGSRSAIKLAKGPDRNKDQPEVERLQANCAHYISRVLNRLNLDLANKLRGFEITVQHYRVLQILFSGDGLTVGQIAQRMVVTLPVLSRILDQMQERELIERRLNPTDARYTHIHLTPKGITLYDQTWTLAKPILDDCLGSLSKQEIAQFLATLQLIDKRINTP